MITVPTSSPNCNSDTEVFFAAVANERKLRKAELAAWDRLDAGLAQTSDAVCIARSCSLLARSWLKNGGCPCVSANVRCFVKKLLTSRVVEVENGK